MLSFLLHLHMTCFFVDIARRIDLTCQKKIRSTNTRAFLWSPVTVGLTKVKLREARWVWHQTGCSLESNILHVNLSGLLISVQNVSTSETESERLLGVIETPIDAELSLLSINESEETVNIASALKRFVF